MRKHAGLEGPLTHRYFEARAARGPLRMRGRGWKPPLHTVIAGLGPASHEAIPQARQYCSALARFIMDARVIRAFTPAFDGLCPRMTPRLWLVKPTHLFKCQTAMGDRPRSLVGAGYALVPFGPRHKPRAWRAGEARHSCLVPHVSLETCGRLSARHSGVVSRRTGHAFENVDQPRLSASSWRQVLVPASGAPSPPGDGGCVFPRPRAPHPLPSIETPRDDAPGRSGHRNNRHKS